MMDKEKETQHTQEDAPVAPLHEEVSEDYKDKWMRALADMDNMRRRFEKEKEDTAAYALTRFAKELLNVADNLARAVTFFPHEQDVKNPLYEGIVLTQKELEKVFGTFGVEKVASVGKTFDPHIHQAMVEQESDTSPAGEILSVLQEGYTLHGRLLRPALVVVAKSKGEQC